MSTSAQAVDRLFPAFHLLDLIQQQIAAALSLDLSLQFVVHILGRDVRRNVHLRIAFLDDMILRYPPPAKFISQHLKDGGLPAGAYAGQDLRSINGLTASM